jgi:hypothetical protein
MRSILASFTLIFLLLSIPTCKEKSSVIEQRQQELLAMNFNRGEIALCGNGDFGNVDFSLSCSEKVRKDFNLAAALLHSFEYAEAEKVFAKVIDADPECVMAYWGIGMSNFHPLWAPPGKEELEKGSKTIALARSLEANERESLYIEAIAKIYDDYEKLDFKTRLKRFVEAAEVIYRKYPFDKEAAVFYALALRSSADPSDKSFVKQKKAGEILNSLFPTQPNHPGIAHYLIHNYDYPEIAESGLPAARQYASIAANSAHAQHMPSHIFTRLGLWDEAIESNRKSTEAAKCYAENLGKKGHWDQELHGLDYLVYAYLQEGRDKEAGDQVNYLHSMDSVFPVSFVNAYTFSAAPVRFALERKDWEMASKLQLHPASFPWERFMWEKAVHHFGRLMGEVNMKDIAGANSELQKLIACQAALTANKKDYEANQVQIQVKTGEAWIKYRSGDKTNAIRLMTEAADMEDATEKHAVTPGEVLPARELLGDMLMDLGNYAGAHNAYLANLKKRPGRFNSLYGAAVSAKAAGQNQEAGIYYKQLLNLRRPDTSTRKEFKEAELFIGKALTGA